MSPSPQDEIEHRRTHEAESDVPQGPLSLPHPPESSEALLREAMPPDVTEAISLLHRALEEGRALDEEETARIEGVLVSTHHASDTLARLVKLAFPQRDSA
ncbi:MAG: hypothetical protein KDD55_10300 [Bdellovibrionales bacterium]|nr:hypothetical protein [Bdellovibrionales bacterium]